MGDFDWELREYQEIICIYKDGNIDMKYEDYKELRLKYEELRKKTTRNNMMSGSKGYL